MHWQALTCSSANRLQPCARNNGKKEEKVKSEKAKKLVENNQRLLFHFSTFLTFNLFLLFVVKRVIGEHNAHIDLSEKRFDIGAEAMQNRHKVFFEYRQ